MKIVIRNFSVQIGTIRLAFGSVCKLAPSCHKGICIFELILKSIVKHVFFVFDSQFTIDFLIQAFFRKVPLCVKWSESKSDHKKGKYLTKQTCKRSECD